MDVFQFSFRQNSFVLYVSHHVSISTDKVLFPPQNTIEILDFFSKLSVLLSKCCCCAGQRSMSDCVPAVDRRDPQLLSFSRERERGEGQVEWKPGEQPRATRELAHTKKKTVRQQQYCEILSQIVCLLFHMKSSQKISTSAIMSIGSRRQIVNFYR